MAAVDADLSILHVGERGDGSLHRLEGESAVRPASMLLWIARIGGLLTIVPLMMVVFGEPGRPSGPREWMYLALFPFGFAAGYLFGWRWPVFGGGLSLVCMAVSLVIVGRVFDVAAYATWAVLCIPGILYVVGGLIRRRE